MVRQAHHERTKKTPLTLSSVYPEPAEGSKGEAQIAEK